MWHCIICMILIFSDIIKKNLHESWRNINSLYFLSVLSLFFFSFTQPSFRRRRMVVPCKDGPAQGFFLLKDSFSLPSCAYLGVQAFQISASVKPLETILLKYTNKLNWMTSNVNHSKSSHQAWLKTKPSKIKTFLWQRSKGRSIHLAICYT